MQQKQTRWRRWRLGAVLLALLLATPVSAQESHAPDLVVTLRDVQGTPVSGVQIVVRNARGDSDISAATTDAQGRVAFAALPVSTVRVAVRGRTSGGGTLTQTGADALGIWLTLAQPPTMLDLRVDADGSVLPDPATMISPDQPVPLGTPNGDMLPTAPLAPALRCVNNGTSRRTGHHAAPHRRHHKHIRSYRSCARSRASFMGGVSLSRCCLVLAA